MNPFISILILISQLFNVIVPDGEGFGDPDEMLCSRAWRNRDSKYWYFVVLFFDYLTPLSLWRYPNMTHCESCFYAEQSRLLKKLKDMKVFEFEAPNFYCNFENCLDD